MENIKASELDRVLQRFATANDNYVSVNIDTDADTAIIKLLRQMGLLEIYTGKYKGFGNELRLSLSSKGDSLYANGGFKAEKTKEWKNKIWEAVKLIRG